MVMVETEASHRHTMKCRSAATAITHTRSTRVTVTSTVTLTWLKQGPVAVWHAKSESEGLSQEPLQAYRWTQKHLIPNNIPQIKDERQLCMLAGTHKRHNKNHS